MLRERMYGHPCHKRQIKNSQIFNPTRFQTKSPNFLLANISAYTVCLRDEESEMDRSRVKEWESEKEEERWVYRNGQRRDKEREVGKLDRLESAVATTNLFIGMKLCLIIMAVVILKVHHLRPF